MPSKKNVLFIFSSLLFIISCANSNTDKNISNCEQESFPNILNIMNVPDSVDDWSAFHFSDLGAWFGYALPDTSKKSSIGLFPGPFLNTHGRWLSARLSKLNVNIGKDSSPIDFDKAENISLTYYPGKLVQSFVVDSLLIKMQLIYASNNSVLVTANIKNKSSKSLMLKANWVGDIFVANQEVTLVDNRVVIQLKNPMMKFYLLSESGTVSISNKNKIKITGKQIALGSEESYTTSIIHRLNYSNDNSFTDSNSLNIFKNKEELLKQNKTRWDRYLTDGLRSNAKWSSNTSYKNIAVKCIETLNTNWKIATGSLTNEGMFPSTSIWYFNGFWAWDIWKQAVATAKFNAELAKNQIRVMFDRQDKFGMIPDVIYADSSENNWRDSKPPLAAWAVYEIYKETNDKNFVNELFTKLVRYHSWWYNYRDHDYNGLCEYGSTDGSKIAALWESGMDDAVRFDDAVILKNSDNAYSLNQESVDLNSYLYAEKLYLSKLAKILTKDKIADIFANEAKNLKILINKKMFNKKTGFFHDINVTEKSFISHQGPEGFIPLWANVASKQNAELVVQTILDSSKFSTYIPFPTVAADDSEYMTGYWRGPVWLDQAYFAIKGLRNYGYTVEADSFTKQLFERLEGLKDSGAPIRENYDPRNGNGLKANNFSWSAAHLLLLYLEE